MYYRRDNCAIASLDLLAPSLAVFRKQSFLLAHAIQVFECNSVIQTVPKHIFSYFPARKALGTDVIFRDFLKNHKKKGAIASLITKKVTRDQVSSYGVVVSDENGRIKAFQEKPDVKKHTGLYTRKTTRSGSDLISDK